MKTTIVAIVTFLTGILYIYLFGVREISLIKLFQTRENMNSAGILLMLLSLLVLVSLDKNSDKNSSITLYEVIKVIFISLSVFLSFELIFGVFSN